MKKKVVPIIKPVIFLALGVIMFLNIQKVLTPDFSSYVSPHMLSGIDALEIEDLDAVFLGSSHVYLGVSPMELYDRHGLRTYILGSSAQPIELSYFLLEKAYESHNIEAVFLDMSMLFPNEKSRSDWNPAWRNVLDQLELGPLKIRMAREYAEHEESDGFLSAIVPIIKYHSNWTQLTERSFYTETKTFDYALGQTFPSMYVPSSVTLEDVERETATLSAYSGKAVVSTGGTVTSTPVDQPLYRPEVPDSNLEYLLKIRDLCASHGSRLILLKVPTRQVPQMYFGTWTSIKSGIVSALAEEYQIPFLDIQYSAPTLLDFGKDTMDGGIHLNAIGAVKVSNYIGEYIKEQGLARPGRNDIYDSLLEQYKKVFSIVELQTTTDFSSYLARLKEAGGHWTVVVSAAVSYVGGMVDEDYQRLSDFGLKLIREGGVRDSYVGVVSKGETVYESYSDYPIYYNGQIEGSSFSAVSRNGWLAYAGASIQVDGQEYSLSGAGLNIVVYLKRFFDALENMDGSLACCLPPAAIRTIFQLTQDKLGQYADKIDFIETATSPLPEVDKQKLCKLLPRTRLYNNYGLSETASVCMYDYNKYPGRQNCVGKATRNSKILIVDDQKKPINSSKNNVGLLACAGDMNMKGYIREPALTSQVLVNGIVYTNDVGYIDADGFIYVTGRKGDVINIGGLKVAPTEVEAATLEYPGIIDCICIPVEDSISEKALKLLMVLKEEQNYSPIEIRKFLATKLESYKVPHYYERVATIARTYNGKLDRMAYTQK